MMMIMMIMITWWWKIVIIARSCRQGDMPFLEVEVQENLDHLMSDIIIPAEQHKGSLAIIVHLIHGEIDNPAKGKLVTINKFKLLANAVTRATGVRGTGTCATWYVASVRLSWRGPVYSGSVRRAHSEGTWDWDQS